MEGLRISTEELKQLLVRDIEVIDETEFDKAANMASRFRIPLERALVERGRIPIAFLLQQIAQFWDVSFIDLRVGDIKQEALRLVPEEVARRHLLIPFDVKNRELSVAMKDPRDAAVLNDLQRTTMHRVRPYLAPENAILRALLLYKGNLLELMERSVLADQQKSSRQGWVHGTEASGVELVAKILEYAAVARASDIHIEPYELETLIRYRIDGTLQEVLSLPPAILPAIVSRVKVLAGLRIDERRAPQDGRFEANLGGFKMDLRVSSLPTHWGEKVVLRVLAKDNVVLDLEDLGIGASDFKIFLKHVLKPFGMVLITGPTGSGKSSTLYAAVLRLGLERQNVVNISTIEDPVEYTMPRVNQVQVNAAAGVEFASGLRALLRQDPDIIMVGEIRDRETADIAVRSALVGRLLLSTLHTNDSTSAVPRLLDMGIEPFLLASTLSLVVAQRLVRRICTSCRESYAPDGSLARVLQAKGDIDKTIAVLQAEGALPKGENPLASVRLFRGKGCHQCSGTGFRGRLGIFEMFEIDGQIKEMIMDRRDATSMRHSALENGMKSLLQDGLAKAFFGETTLEEVFRAAM